VSQPDPGSFRDPASHVVVGDQSVLRLLDERGLADWRALAASRVLHDGVASGRIIATEEDEPHHGAVACLRHPRLPVITYPFEWTFTMLRDAAVLQLDLLAAALREGLTIKDATPYNFQFVDGAPVFIDVGSFARYRDGEPWLGYRQFCRQFLYPLMLTAWVGVPFQPWLRGDPEGPTALQMRRLLPMRRRVHPGALAHVELQSRAEARMQGRSVRSSLADAGFTVDMILANVNRMRSLVASFDWQAPSGTWSGYRACDHVGRDRASKTQFLTKALDELAPGTVLDLGANDGYYSTIASRHGATTVAVDGDAAVLDRVYRDVAAAGLPVVPVLTDLTNPSPAQGWGGVERRALFARVTPDLVIAYGLIHHLIYVSSIPPPQVIEWLASFETPVLLEYVAPEDPMIARLTANKRPEELHPERGEAEFEKLIRARFDIARIDRLAGDTRILYDLRVR
jgi:ribosomal protein L11 methylase PrmA